MVVSALNPGVTNRLTTQESLPAPDTADEANRLAVALEAPAPALFVLWQDATDNVVRFIDVCLGRGAAHIHLQRINGDRNGGLQMEDLRVSLPGRDKGIVSVLLGCLSSVHPERRAEINAGRNFWMELGRRVLFVEPIAREVELKRDFPDIFSLVRDEVKLYAPARDDCPSAQPSSSGGRAGEVISVEDDGSALCWVEVANGEQVKVRFSRELIGHLDPCAGREFVWAPNGVALCSDQFWVREVDPLPVEEQQTLEQLRRRFFERVQQGELLEDEAE